MKEKGSARASVAPSLVESFNRAAAIARSGAHAEAERAYAALVGEATTPGATATREFIAVTRMRHAFCLMDLTRYDEARVELEATRALASHLSVAQRYELFFALGNTLGACGDLDGAFVTLVEAISVAEDMDDYVDRPAQCWKRILAIGAERSAWKFVAEKASIAQNTARLRGMTDLDALATKILATLPA